MKPHKYRSVVRQYPWLDTVTRALAHRYELIDDPKAPLPREVLRHLIDHVALHSVHSIEWDEQRGGQKNEGVIHTWIPFLCEQDGILFFPDNIYAGKNAKEVLADLWRAYRKNGAALYTLVWVTIRHKDGHAIGMAIDAHLTLLPLNT